MHHIQAQLQPFKFNLHLENIEVNIVYHQKMINLSSLLSLLVVLFTQQ